MMFATDENIRFEIRIGPAVYEQARRIFAILHENGGSVRVDPIVDSRQYSISARFATSAEMKRAATVIECEGLVPRMEAAP